MEEETIKNPAFFRTLSLKLFIALLLIIVFLFGLYSLLCSHIQNKIYEDTIGLAAYRMSDLAKNSLYRLMLLNEREELYHTIQLMSSEPGIESISIYNKKLEFGEGAYIHMFIVLVVFAGCTASPPQSQRMRWNFKRNLSSKSTQFVTNPKFFYRKTTR